MVYWKGGDKFMDYLRSIGGYPVFQSLVYWKGGDKCAGTKRTESYAKWFQSLVYWKGGDKYIDFAYLSYEQTSFNPWFIGRVGINNLLV